MNGRAIGAMAALASAAALAAGASGAAGKDDNRKSEHITCTVKLAAQAFPDATAPGFDYGQITCSGPFGFGMQYDTFTLTPTSPTDGTAALDFKAYFDGGRADGTWALTFSATGPCDLNFEIDAKFDGGTGKYKHLQGSGSGSGDFTDLAAAPNCNHATFTFGAEVTGV